uniref:Putative group i salivary lipocalin n=1 Tax=Rhipicephalus pulchellus TaxID=72859 RepID=L7LR42_RHIPC
MKQSSLYAMVILVLYALLFTLCLNPVESFSFFPFKKKKAYNIGKFLDTKEPIWTYTTSRRANVWCEVGVTDNVTEDSVFFKRSSYDRKGRTSATLEGKLSDKKKHMHIRSPDGVYTLEEDIIYMNRNGSCAVIMVTTTFGGKQSTFDLRVRNSSIAWGPTEKCKKRFRKLEGQGQNIYQPQCQRILTDSLKGGSKGDSSVNSVNAKAE